MQKNDLIFLYHVQGSIHKIQAYTNGISEGEFLSNSLIHDAVIRNFEIIGEASKYLSEELKRKHPQVQWKRIAGMRDKLIHGYFGVDLLAVWAVVTDILPGLDKEISQIINQIRP
ncbi:HepT-like ribonuclease domain-containing protein [Litoribacter populi]|uniref:HepT-like ribonuclease domain-containing protein n=1 Tax=Litoribacter populi TaxID=2598460 RepID=UPI001180C8DB|nr:DUF86 domain-containing protein [Litoribacter populi]